MSPLEIGRSQSSCIAHHFSLLPIAIIGVKLKGVVWYIDGTSAVLQALRFLIERITLIFVDLARRTSRPQTPPSLYRAGRGFGLGNETSWRLSWPLNSQFSASNEIAKHWSHDTGGKLARYANHEFELAGLDWGSHPKIRLLVVLNAAVMAVSTIMRLVVFHILK